VVRKSTVEGTLRPVLDKYEVPFQVVHGWSGATPIHDAVAAALDRNQESLILYVGDFDPSGMGMSELDLPKRFARYSSNDPSNKDITIELAKAGLRELGIEIRRIALTKEHTQSLGVATRFPASDKKDDTRYKWFVENYGEWCWELDALSPVDLRQCVEAAIEAELDQEEWDRYVLAEEEERKTIIETCSTWKSILEQDQEYSGELEE
jgi:hypothetical protein